MRSYLPFLSLMTGTAMAFVPPAYYIRPSTTKLFDATGGWGSTNSREMSDLEKKGGKRRSFDKYESQESGEFLRQVQKDRKAMMELERKELLSVAEFAGIEFKDPALDEFTVDLFMEDEDDIDFRVELEEGDDGEVYLKDEPDDDVSITRMDEDTGAPGVW